MKVGQLVTPTLKLARLLGKGGMGSVWLADHLTLGTQVAIKFMSIANIDDPTLMQRFQTEAKAAAQIKHPHVAQVFDHGVTSDGIPYIVMEYLEGEDLKHAIRRGGPMAVPEVARLVVQSAKALARAHHLGIVHRDIKPDNIFLCNIDGEMFVKLLDFGVAKIDQGSTMSEATTTGSMMGTPLYMSPEQLLSARTVNFKSDLWSLAVVAYFSLTGRVPFGGETIGALSVAVHLGNFQPVTALRPDLPPTLDAWFTKMLKKDPNERFTSAKEMAEAFEIAAAVRAPMGSIAMGSSFDPLGQTGAFLHAPALPPALSQSTPSTPSMPSMTSMPSSDSQHLVGVPQPTFSGTASDAGKRGGASKKQLMIAAGSAGGSVLLIAILVIAFSSGSDDSSDKPDLAAQPDKPVIQAVSALPAPPPVMTTSEPTVEPVTSASTKKKSEKTPRVVTPSPAPAPKTGPTTKPNKDTIGF
ncbi:MAG TPA: serine/threonine-protein kinase [Polyangium sp.]|nr:serine/threonine-protein kinase [Polyangium sp.]